MKTLLEVIKLNKGNIDKVKTGNETFMDFELPSRNLWGICNLGADKPEEPGNYYQWGDTEPCRPNKVNWDNYKFKCYDRFDLSVDKYDNIDNLKELEPEDDAAVKSLGSQYRIPSKEDFDELLNNTLQVLTLNYNQTGIEGLIVFKVKNEDDKGKFYKHIEVDEYDESMDEHIFIPATGFIDDGRIRSHNDKNEVYLYARNRNNIKDVLRTWVFHANKFGIETKEYSRIPGMCIRPIKFG